MPQSGTFSCYAIGADNLLSECGEELLRKGHEIRGILTDAERVVAWARSHDIPVLDPSSDLVRVLAEEPFDYLFSIAHLEIIPDEILALPQELAVNFHDGPLPRYAGLNAPAWALMNQEAVYGITWHVMTSDVDRGDILKQTMFDIDSGETSISINTRCFEAGIAAFSELIDELSSNTVNPKVQAESRGEVCRRFDRPEAACVLDWAKPAKVLEAFIRALTFGPYANPLGSPKLLVGGEVFTVTQAEARGEPVAQTAGTLLTIGAEEIGVATGDGVLAIQGLAKVTGQPQELKRWATRMHLHVGDRLVSPSAELSDRLTELNTSLCRSEDFWAERLSSLRPAEVPLVALSGESGGAADSGGKAVEFDIPASFRQRFGGAELQHAVAVAFGAYLWRLGDSDVLDVGFYDDALRACARDLEPYVCGEVPLRFEFPADQTFTAALETTREAFSEVHRRKVWLKDLVARRPELRRLAEAGGAMPLRVALELGASRAARPTGARWLTLAGGEEAGTYRFTYCPVRFDESAVKSMAAQCTTFLENVAQAPDAPLSQASLIGEAQLRRMLVDWNQTRTEYRRDVCVHELFEEQVARTPSVVALVCEEAEITYGDLNTRADELAAYLQDLGIGPEKTVGVFLDRSIDLMVASLGVLKAGGAYVPLDPTFPGDRVAFMIEDSRVSVIITSEALYDDVPEHGARVLQIDRDWSTISNSSLARPSTKVKPSNLAYLIYTSGSTGKPKGVMVEHGNVVNFFRGMDEHIPHDPPGTWLAVTTLAFDISVLELFWTLAHGFKVILHADRERGHGTAASAAAAKGMDFGLFFWGNDGGSGRRKYRLLLEAARYADTHGFSSVWTPERHFHAFGGPYPNPSVTGAAVAAVTENVAIRSGSCVLPLHHPIRVAEEWAVIDNLSDGRVGLGVAAGWQPHDFVLKPENYDNNKKKMFAAIEEVQRLWRGEAIKYAAPDGEMVDRVSQPRPVQPELPLWLTVAGNPESYRQAGQMGANVLTHLLGQSVDEVGGKIRIYRDALRDSGRDPNSGQVTLMLHTFVTEYVERARDLARGPMKEYLASAVNLVKQFAWVFPAFKRPGGPDSTPDDIDLDQLSAEEVDTILEYAYQRYFEESGLFGTPSRCLKLVNQLKRIGVDEIGCLVDFGIPADEVLASLRHLNTLRELANPAGVKPGHGRELSIPALIERHGVTHIQCTPSMAHMLVTGTESREALSTVQHLFVGGEAFPVSLARELGKVMKGTVTNMYGPTETTIWSSTHRVHGDEVTVPIGKPIANTQLYILDCHGQPVPAGVPGELYIGGDGVTRGYFDRPGLTAERFVPNPFDRERESRMYRTGDLARFRDDGTVEFLGRNDFQVKVRGYRIELGEIEAAMNCHQAVRETIVAAIEVAADDRRLVAYYVPDGPAPSVDDLKHLLRRALPDYMVPSHFVSMDRFPLTPNGKIDRKQLPSLDARAAPSTAAYAKPANELEQTMAALWRDALGLERVGIDDNFFDIGGHSLLLVRVHRALEEVVSKPVSLTDLYRFSTIRSLSRFLKSDGASGSARKSGHRGQRRRAAMGRKRQRSVRS